MHATIHRSFNLNSVAVVNHSDRIRIRYITKQGVQIAGMIFQTRSGVARHTFFFHLHLQLHASSLIDIVICKTMYAHIHIQQNSYVTDNSTVFFQTVKKILVLFFSQAKIFFYHFFSYYYSSASSEASVVSVSALSVEAFVSGSVVSAFSFSSFSPVTDSNA